MDNVTFEKFITAAKNDERILYDPDFYSEYRNIIIAIYNDVEKFDIYNFNGQFQDILVNVTKRFSPIKDTNMYIQFLTEIYQELKQLVLPTVIIIPLNNFKINLTPQQCHQLTENIRIFQPKDSKETDDAFSKYYKEVTHSDIDKNHILTAKDRNFFHHPVMTIVVNNIPFKVNEQSVRITEAVYSVMRMVDFNVEEPLFTTRKSLIKAPPASTYCVYWATLKPYICAYGYSSRFRFEYLLDINSDESISRIESIKRLLNRYINFCFIDRRNKTDSELRKIDKWLNAVLLYNTAYELAAAERYDVANIILLTILESFFLNKSTKQKQLKLAELVSKFIFDHRYAFETGEIETLIRETYNHRNNFVHEGKNYYNAKLFKNLGERQGAIFGMKPFAHGTSCSSETHSKLQTLIKVVGYVIMSFWD